jgi:predicted GH43/DUF377 family glycosyl hydrolase
MTTRDIPLDNLIKDYPYIFNGAIFKYNNETFLAYRANKTTKDCKLLITKTDEWWNPVGKSWEIRIPILNNLFEDPRFIQIKNVPYLLVTQVDLASESQFQGVVELTSNLRYKNYFKINYGDNWTAKEKFIATSPSNVHYIDSHNKKNPTFEKNWSFFVDDDKPCFIYKTQPLTMFVNLNDKFELENESSSFKSFTWPFGEIRGGTSSIKVGEHYYHFFHSSALADPYYELDEQGIGRIYYIGCYTFKKIDNGYELLKITKIPLELGDYTDNVVLWRNCSVFPCGVVYEDNHFKVSYGWHDYKLKLLTISMDELCSFFVPLKTPVFNMSPVNIQQ